MYLLFQFNLWDGEITTIACFSTEESAVSAKHFLEANSVDGVVLYNGERFAVDRLDVEYVPEWEDSLVGRRK